ncbi:hypothetical protein FACS1894216_00690 [Synergistales bacterium]|nr:hypothetical protein FACS1894216_00690 [Synergistales bacterium]
MTAEPELLRELRGGQIAGQGQLTCLTLFFGKERGITVEQLAKPDALAQQSIVIKNITASHDGNYIDNPEGCQ